MPRFLPRNKSPFLCRLESQDRSCPICSVPHRYRYPHLHRKLPGTTPHRYRQSESSFQSALFEPTMHSPSGCETFSDGAKRVRYLRLRSTTFLELAFPRPPTHNSSRFASPLSTCIGITFGLCRYTKGATTHSLGGTPFFNPPSWVTSP